MTSKSTIMDTNSFSADALDLLDGETRQLVERRLTVLGGAYRLFYQHPVHLVRGEGQYLWDAAGAKYLDMYNNVASVGHANPTVARAVADQMMRINTHTRYAHENIVDYSEQILATMPSEITRAMYMCTGSEANDLAIRVAREYSGGTGIIVSSEAYHGNTDLTSRHSPALGGGQPLDAACRRVRVPSADAMGGPGSLARENSGQAFAHEIEKAIDDLESHGVRFAGFLADSIFSSDGVHPGQAGWLAPAVDVVHRHGGVFIADEVQPGFARTGEAFWGFARHGVVPDLVTTGKPMGNGIPVSGLFARDEVLAAFSDRLPYFNTFGGSPVSMAAALAVLHEIQSRDLQQHALQVGERLRTELRRVAERHVGVGDVRGVGLYTGVDIVSPADGQTADGALALAVLEGLRERRLLTSVAGAAGNVLKLRPPLVFDMRDIDRACTTLDETLSALDA
ncbi:aspartate aminotransferase family protein [Pseudoclavibacter sp. CFCC 13611]|uniref:aspartate aminotransferase family protein n=1 Tax=Pseudoclavibacter sp. CFCC 13611 TaxID=2615178 RepID=UPI0013013BC6|nr:aspartate aminotransferase family protein [Pseudoclavibacter sp. CFCC 13611]KAB1663881.1 aspartate aminotransferase family protein [Pseudoclavibacter sp. CFCC 13611]